MSQEDNPLVEIQRRKTQIGRQLIQAQGQLTMKTRIANSTRLTIAEIDKLPETTKTYRTVGRMFLATPLAQVKEGLQKVLSESKSDMGQLESRIKRLEKDGKSVMDELKKVAAESTGG